MKKKYEGGDYVSKNYVIKLLYSYGFDMPDIAMFNGEHFVHFEVKNNDILVYTDKKVRMVFNIKRKNLTFRSGNHLSITELNIKNFMLINPYTKEPFNENTSINEFLLIVQGMEMPECDRDNELNIFRKYIAKKYNFENLDKMLEFLNEYTEFIRQYNYKWRKEYPNVKY